MRGHRDERVGLSRAGKLRFRGPGEGVRAYHSVNRSNILFTEFFRSGSLPPKVEGAGPDSAREDGRGLEPLEPAIQLCSVFGWVWGRSAPIRPVSSARPCPERTVLPARRTVFRPLLSARWTVF